MKSRPRFLVPALAAALSFSLLTGGCAGTDDRPHRTLTLRVVVPALPEGQIPYLSGNLTQLGSWKPDAIPLERISDSLWTTRVSVPHGSHIEFKLTRGTWRTEAVGADGLELPNYSVDGASDTIVVITVAAWRDNIRRPALLSAGRMQNKGGTIELSDEWRFSPGDNSSWAEPAWNDSAWTFVDPMLPAEKGLPNGWNGKGWFRLRLEVDSTLWNVPLAFFMRQTGASEIYLNGMMIARLGKLGSPGVEEEGFTDFIPRMIVPEARWDQVLAVRYSNTAAEEFHQRGRIAGFAMWLGDPAGAILETARETRVQTIFQVLFSTVAVLLALIHFFLFVFDPTEKANLYFSILTGSLAVASYIDFQGLFVTLPKGFLLLDRLAMLPVALVMLSAPLTVYAFRRRTIPFHFWLLAALTGGAALWSFFSPPPFSRYVIPLLAGLISVEVLRVLVLEMVRPGKQIPGTAIGGWIAGIGGAVYVLATLYQLLLNAGVLPVVVPFPAFYAGFLVFALSISINLAQQWSATNRELRLRLAEVQELSTRAIEQERKAREEEVMRRLLEADYDRKTLELEEARKLQLSMLPKSIPTVPGIRIGVFMRTATEVGGDYYDFRQDEDGSLTIALGDATGHGTRAGIMVTLIKSLFMHLGHSFYIPDFFNHCTASIRKMNMEGIYMGLALVRLRGRVLTASSAGMPPLCLYRAATGEVEDLVMKGMPLGAHPGYPYLQETRSLEPGDTLLMMSDGLAELFDPGKEMFDFARVRQVFREAAAGSPDDVVRRLTSAADEWAGGGPPNDDITLVVVKAV